MSPSHHASASRTGHGELRRDRTSSPQAGVGVAGRRVRLGGSDTERDAAEHERESDALHEPERLARQRDAEHDSGDRVEQPDDADDAGGQAAQAA